ncbi:primase-helicase family protein [Pseudorhodoplanes sp.]|uniref:primase-helicase family protein n=1 Tax=Pseudorhodoplanes sp. TaxID=1934341 RepID=UPI003D0B1262
MNIHVQKEQGATSLPVEDSPEFEAQIQRIQEELTSKFAWSAQQDGIIYRRDPLLGKPMDDKTFNRVSRANHSFRYRNHKGEKLWFYSMQDIISALDDPELDFGFILTEGVQFLPGEPEVTADEMGRKVLNLWRAPEWEVRQEFEEPSVFLEHVAYLYDGDQAAVDHILDFMAHMVQRPAQRVNHALLLTSEAKGIGKSTLGTIMRKLVGVKNSRVAQAKDLKSSFDGWLVGQLLIQVDEIYEYGNWDLSNKLKGVITDPTISVNLKYQPQMEVRNFARLVLFSNHTAPIDLEEGDRRYFVFNSQAQPRDGAYYEALHGFIDDTEGVNAIYSYLMKRELSGFKPFAPPPMTQAKSDIIEVSGNPLRHYILDAVESGHLVAELGSSEASLGEIQRLLTKEGYGQHAKSVKELGSALRAAGVTKVRRGSGQRRSWKYVFHEVERQSEGHAVEF